MTNNDPYYIDFPGRIKQIQQEMAKEGLDAYLGSRLRTLSWTLDAFCPWRSYIVIPREGMPVAFTFAIDAARVADDTWLDEDNVRGYAPMGGQDQITQIADYIKEDLNAGSGCIGYETGLSNYLPEGNLTHYEYEMFKDALPDATFINAHHIIDQLALIKDEGTINRFREASRQVDAGHKAVYEALIDGGFKKLTETEVAGIAALAMRREGSEWEWSFTGGNEIASGYRTGYIGGACTPPGRRKLQPGEPLMVDLHAMFKLGLGDHSVNYLLAPATDRQWWHANNFTDIVKLTLSTYKAGVTPSGLAAEMLAFADEKGFSDYMVPGFEHGIGMMGDEWRIGKHDGPIPYWTDPFHVYQENEMLICAMQYACEEDGIGFRYEAPIVIKKDGIELQPKHPLEILEIK
ncbi:MAG: M24 family metallopeptidase [Bacillota bacterium]|nr:M24 family metallopeptidase [Bacillota bacterium]